MRFRWTWLVAVLAAIPTGSAIGQGNQRPAETPKSPTAPQKGDLPPPAGTRPTSEDDMRPLQPRTVIDFSPWMSGGEYQRLFDENLRNRHYPESVEGRSSAGQRQFRASFMPFPDGPFAFWSHHGLNADQFSLRDRELRGQGFRLIARQSFDDAGGRVVQGTWVRP